MTTLALLLTLLAADDRDALADLAARQRRPLVLYMGVPVATNDGWIACRVAGPPLGCVVYMPDRDCGGLTFAGTTNNPWCVRSVVDEQAEVRGLGRMRR